MITPASENNDEVWVVAYGIAFAMTALGGEIRGEPDMPEQVDARARDLADKACATIAERVKEAKAKKPPK